MEASHLGFSLIQCLSLRQGRGLPVPCAPPSTRVYCLISYILIPPLIGRDPRFRGFVFLAVRLNSLLDFFRAIGFLRGMSFSFWCQSAQLTSSRVTVRPALKPPQAGQGPEVSPGPSRAPAGLEDFPQAL